MGGRAVGLIGLGVMGQNLALNFHNHGYSVAVYNRTEQKTREFVANHPEILGTYGYADFVNALDRPRRIFLMVTAGSAVDATLSSLERLLSPGDVVMDGGNSYFQDTERRCGELSKLGVHYLGVGVSGGEEGALKGPMYHGWGSEGRIRAGQGDAITNRRTSGRPLLSTPWTERRRPLREDGPQRYRICNHPSDRRSIRPPDPSSTLERQESSGYFRRLERGRSKLIPNGDCSRSPQQIRPRNKRPLVSVILDRAKQKGTGKWTSQNAMDLGIPTPTIDAAVSSRNLSGLKEERVNAAKILKPQRAPESSTRSSLEF